MPQVATTASAICTSAPIVPPKAIAPSAPSSSLNQQIDLSIPWPNVPSIAEISVDSSSTEHEQPLKLFQQEVKLLKLLGTGQYGRVYKAQKDNDTFAIKIISCKRGTTDTREPFMMKIVGQHHGILPLLHAIVNPWFTVLKFPLFQMDLATALERAPSLIERFSILAAKQLTSAVAHLGQQKVIHRDLHLRNGSSLTLTYSLTKETVLHMPRVALISLHAGLREQQRHSQYTRCTGRFCFHFHPQSNQYLFLVMVSQSHHTFMLHFCHCISRCSCRRHLSSLLSLTLAWRAWSHPLDHQSFPK